MRATLNRKISMIDNVDVAVLCIIALVLYYFVWSKKKKPSQAIEAKYVTRKKSLFDKIQSIDSDRKAVLFYGSQTGTAEDFANRTMKQLAVTFGVKALVLDLDEYEMSEIARESENCLFGFFMATYGEGEPTDNAAEFYSWIMDGNGLGDDKGDQEDHMVLAQELKGLCFFVFGLGNKTYEHYNAIGRRLKTRIINLGGKCVSYGEGDDNGTIEDDYLCWKKSFVKDCAQFYDWELLESSQKSVAHISAYNLLYPLDAAAYKGELTGGKTRSWYKIQTDDECETEDDKKLLQKFGPGLIYKETTNQKGFDAKTPFYGRLLQSQALYTNSVDEFKVKSKKIDGLDNHATFDSQKDIVQVTRQCYHIEFELMRGELEYETGDHVGIWPSNDPTAVLKLANKLGCSDLQKVIDLVPNPANPMSDTVKLNFPSPCTLNAALSHYLDLNAPLKNHHFEIISKYATSEKERDMLWDISQDRELFKSTVESSQKVLFDILCEFPSINLPLEVALGEILPRIAVRYYSISSSSKESPTKFSITAVVVRYALDQQNSANSKQKTAIRSGLATSYLERMHELREKIHSNQIVPDLPIPLLHAPFIFRKSTFKLPKDHGSPIIMVGPGTGIAPFRGFVRERFYLALERTKIGPTLLFNGCRNEEKVNHP
jgi:NADPH-ferrihemoprotein reductase